MAQVDRREVNAIVLPAPAPPTLPTVITVEQGKGVLLVAGTSYVFMLSSADASFSAIHLKWDAALIVSSATVEDSCLPRSFGENMGGGAGASTPDILDTSTTAGDWIINTLPAAQVSVISTGGTSGAASYTAATGVLAWTGGTAGGAILSVQERGSARMRLKVTVGATGGYLRVGQHRKS